MNPLRAVTEVFWVSTLETADHSKRRELCHVDDGRVDNPEAAVAKLYRGGWPNSAFIARTDSTFKGSQVVSRYIQSPNRDNSFSHSLYQEVRRKVQGGRLEARMTTILP